MSAAATDGSGAVPAAYCPLRLLEIASEADARYQSLRVQYPPGTVHDGRNAAYREREAALACAAWMEASGIDSLACVGPFGPQDIPCGSEVVIAQGAVVYSTKPGVPREGLKSARAQRVKVHSCFRGGVLAHEDMRVKQGEVHWAGASGYWRWTDINNVVRSA